jgi:hypothetical protein
VSVVADLRQLLIASLGYASDHVTTTPIDDRQSGITQTPVLMVLPAGGPLGDGDFWQQRVRLQAVADTYDAARGAFQAAADVLLQAGEWPAVAAGPSQDYPEVLGGGIEKPAHGVDYYLTVPVGTPV